MQIFANHDLINLSITNESSVEINMISLFLSHASEDKDELVRPLAAKLRSDFDVWYDEYELVLGDSLLQKISEGLHKCDYGIVVLSHHFFEKRWPRSELDGLFALETNERKVILPIWHGVLENEVKGYSPILASRLAVSSADGLDKIIDEIKRAVGLTERVRDLQQSKWKEKFSTLDEGICHKKAVETLYYSTQGVLKVTTAARPIISEAQKRAETLVKSCPNLRINFNINSSDQDSFSLHSPVGIWLNFYFSTLTINSLQNCTFRIHFYKPINFHTNKFETIYLLELLPQFDKEMNVFWQDHTHTFSSTDAILDFAFEKFAELIGESTRK